MINENLYKAVETADTANVENASEDNDNQKNESKIINATRTFAIEGYEKVSGVPKLDKHRHVLEKKNVNFSSKPSSNFKFHRWSGSVTSSQAFAHNLCSGMEDNGVDVEFEAKFCTLNVNGKYTPPAQIDVKIVTNKIVKLYEVKFFEFLKNKKFELKENYYKKESYKNGVDFIPFIEKVESFINKLSKKNYYEGIKQLCCHLLGIINSLDSTLKGKNIELYSLCFDNEKVSDEFKKYLGDYKFLLDEFKKIVDKYLHDTGLNSRITFCGYIGASDFIKENRDVIGKKNLDYVKQRYYYNNLQMFDEISKNQTT